MIRRHGAQAFLACAALVALACTGCGASASGETPSAPSSSLRAAPAGPGPGAGAPSRSAPRSCPARVFSRMTLAQRVGQLFLVGVAGDPGPEVAWAVRAHHFGSLLFATASTAGLAETRRVTQAVQALASAQGTAGIRFFIAANQEGGQVQQLKGPGFPDIPPALAQGAMPASALQQRAAGWGRELRSAGVNLDLAPVMDVVPSGTAGQNQPIGALQREFGGSPQAVAAHGVAVIRGMRQAGVATAAKHFPGLGRVRGNTDFTERVVDTATGVNDAYLGSFRAAIGAGVPFVMVALATYTRIDPRRLAAFSPRVMRGMLRQQLRFTGVIVSDDLGVARAVSNIPAGLRAIGFLAAGGDLITSQSLAAADVMDSAVLERAGADPAFRALADAAVMRVLTAKQAYGLLPCAGS